MSRSVFGWDLPPGVTSRMIDEACGVYADESCEVCAQDMDRCICPECPVCGEVGDANCYHPTDGHGLVRSFGQVALKADTEARWEAEAEAEAAYWDNGGRAAAGDEDPDPPF